MKNINAINYISLIKKMNNYTYLSIAIFIILLQYALSLLIFNLGGVKLSLPYLMVLIIIIGSSILGAQGGFLLGLAGGIFLGPFMPLDVETVIMQDFSNWFFRLFSYVVIGIFSGSIMSYLINIIDKFSTLTLYDSVTKLPNLKYLENMDFKRHPYDFYFASLKFENLDKLKANFGQQYSEDFERDFSKILIDIFNFKKNHRIFDLGHGEFGVIFSEENLKENFYSLCKSVFKKIKKKEIAYVPTVFIGVCRFEGEITTIIKNAKLAREFSKESLKRYEIYSENMRVESNKNNSLIFEIPRAIKKKEFFLMYHPKINNFSGRIKGVEALIRWQHPTKGLINPNDFIPYIEKTSMIESVTEWVIKTALADLKKMESEKIDIDISVNVPIKLFENSGFIRKIKRYGNTFSNLKKLEFEILERGDIENFEDVSTVIDSLKEMGIKFSLDDFGTGYSSLLYIQNLPLDIIKIDKSFLQNIVNNKKNKEIVQLSINLGKALDKKVLAEGVEDEKTLETLKNMGCDYSQGYFFTKPLRYNEFLEWYKNYSV